MLAIEEIVTWSNKVGAKVLVDACQSVPHMPVDVQQLGADFLVASSHKVFVIISLLLNNSLTIQNSTIIDLYKLCAKLLRCVALQALGSCMENLRPCHLWSLS